MTVVQWICLYIIKLSAECLILGLEHPIIPEARKLSKISWTSQKESRTASQTSKRWDGLSKIKIVIAIKFKIPNMFEICKLI